MQSNTRLICSHQTATISGDVMAVNEVHKNGRTQFEVLYYLNGERRRLYYPTRAAATRKWGRIQAAKRNTTAQLEGMTQKERSRLLQAYERAQAGEYDLHEACQFFEDANNRGDKVKFTDSVSEFLVAKEAKGLKPRSVETYRAILNRAGDYFWEEDFHEIALTDVEAWVEGLGYAAKGYNHFMSTLNTLRNWAAKKGYYVGDRNPFFFEKRIEDAPEVGILTVEAARDYLGASMRVPEVAAISVLVLLCGMRTSEALASTWDHVHLDEDPVIVEVSAQSAKKRQRRMIELQPNAAAWLRLAKERGGRLAMVDEMYYRAKREALPEIPANGLRHSFCSYHLAHFKNIALTAHFAGNSPAMIEKHYKELVRPRVAAKFWEIWAGRKD